MSGFENDVMVSANVNFNNAGAKPHLGIISSNGQLLIGNAVAPFLRAGVLTSPLGTISIGYSAPNITLDLMGNAPAIEKIAVQTGTSPVVPSGGIITINGATVTAGTNPVRTDGTGANTLAVEVQKSQAIASTDATKIGLAAFNSANFSVDSNAFVSVIGGGLAWVDATGATQTIAVQTGYLADRGGGVAFTLPASATLGDVFRIVGLQGSWTLAQAAGQQIKFGNTATTVGATGSLASTNAGDCIECVATNTSASTVWRVMSSVGNITVS